MQMMSKASTASCYIYKQWLQKLLKCILKPLSDILPQALGPVHLITSQFMAKYDNREVHQISQTRRTATHDAPWSFLF